jgi:hypothetical protein
MIFPNENEIKRKLHPTHGESSVLLLTEDEEHTSIDVIPEGQTLDLFDERICQFASDLDLIAMPIRRSRIRFPFGKSAINLHVRILLHSSVPM